MASSESNEQTPWSKVRARYRSSRLFRWVVDLGLLLLAITVIGIVQTRHHPRGPFPEYLFTDFQSSSPVRLSQFHGKPTLVTVWAPWCGVCKAEADNIGRARSWLGERAHVVSVATSYQQVAQVKAFIDEHQVGYPVLLAGEDLSSLLGIDAFPTLFVLDERGSIVNSSQGYVTTLGLVWQAFRARF